jgi:L-cystine uptake protein TcyP (sodium:dicarboxylate symporter family)
MIITLFDTFILLLSVGLLHSVRYKLKQLSFRVLFGLVLGVGYGLLLKLAPPAALLEEIKGMLYLVGNGYLALLRMLVIPLILTSIVNAILTLGGDSEHLIRTMSYKTCALLLGMTSVSSLIGLLVGKWFNVGYGFSLPAINLAPTHTYTGMADALLGMLPANPVAAMAQENTIAIVLFAVIFGIAARMTDQSDEKMRAFKQYVAVLFTIVKKMASLVLSFTPYGVLALMALLILDQGMLLVSGMLNFIVAMYAAMLIVMLMHSLILLTCGQSPWSYYKKAYTPLLVAFTTRSSFGTLPVTEETLRNKFNVSQTAATFVPSIGATIGMNACAGVFPAMLVVMTLTVLHQPLTVQMMLMVMFINAIASLGISGIPGTAYIAATITLTSLNLPYAIVALVQGIDPVIDMGRTATNVNGVMTAALVVDRKR